LSGLRRTACRGASGLSIRPTGEVIEAQNPSLSLSSRLPRALRWALALPFLVMPVSLTIDAPDVHGGFGMHIRLAIILGVVGALAALAVARGSSTTAWLQRQVRLRAAFRLSGEFLLLLALAHVATTVVVELADGIAQLVQLVPEGFGGATDVWGPTPVSRGMLAIAFLLLGQGVRCAPGLRLAALSLGACLSAVLVTRLVSLALVDAKPLWVEFPLVFGIAVVLVWALINRRKSSTPPDSPPSARWERAAHELRLIRSQRPSWWLARLALTGSTLAVALLALRLATVCSDSLLSLFEVGDGHAPLEAPGITLALWLVIFGRASFSPRGSGWGHAAALAWCVFVLIRTGGMIGLETGSDLPGLVAGLFLLPIVLSRRLPGPSRWSAVLTALIAGPVVGAYITTNLLDGSYGGSVAWGLGSAATALLCVLRLERRRQPRPPGAPLTSKEVMARAGSQTLLLIGALIPMFVGIALGIHGVLTWITLGIVAGLLLLPRLSPVIPLWGLFYVAFILVMIFKLGPSPTECASVAENDGVRLLRDRFDEDVPGEPYDVLPDPRSGALLASFKRTDEVGGFFELLDPTQPDRNSRLTTRRTEEQGGTPLWPERMVLDPLRGTVWAQLLGIEDYAMWELRVTPAGPASGLELIVLRELPITWEPGNPAVDFERDRLVLSYVPNRSPSNPLLEVFALSDLSTTAKIVKSGRRLQMADFVAIDSKTGDYWVPALFDFIRFALVEVDGASGETFRRREIFHPAIGIAADSKMGRLYITNPIAGRIEVWDQASLSLLESHRAGRFPRDISWDEERGLLYVGGYADGRVTTFERTQAGLEQRAVRNVGSLLRGLGLNRETGQVFAASGCGIFELSTLE
jgi:hypothetical protein